MLAVRKEKGLSCLDVCYVGLSQFAYALGCSGTSELFCLGNVFLVVIGSRYPFWKMAASLDMT